MMPLLNNMLFWEKYTIYHGSVEKSKIQTLFCFLYGYCQLQLMIVLMSGYILLQSFDQMHFLPLMLSLLFLPIISGAQLSSFINNRLLIRRNCHWTQKSHQYSTLLSTFFSAKRGECLYGLREVEKELFFIVEIKDSQDRQEREIIINLRIPLKENQTKYVITFGKRLEISFRNSNSLTLYAKSLIFLQQMNNKKAFITLSPSRSKISLTLSKNANFQFFLDLPRSSYNEQLIAIWLVFVFLNYHWFYFTKNEGVILREFRSIKKGWCFRTVIIFLVNHTSFPLSFNHQFQKFAQYVIDHKDQLVQIGLILVIMAAILLFIGFQMGKLMKKVSYRSKEPLHIRQALDYILIFAILVIPFEYVLVLMPISKFLQIWHLLTLEQSNYINYYQNFGKVAFDWIQGLYFTVYDKNFALLEPNIAASAFILSIFVIEVMIFLMELFSPRQFKEMKAAAVSLYSSFSTFYIRIEAMRAQTEKCAICLQNFSSKGGLQVVDEGKQEIFEATNVAVTRCSHRFHAACIEKWFREGNQNCPLDRQDLKNQRKKKTKSKSKEPKSKQI